MCTLTLAWQVFEYAPVCVAANRDESYGRPSEPPAERDGGVIAPRDAEAGGTWMGVTRDGLFVGVTNRWVEGLAGERSRGLLVDDCLRAGSAEDAARLVERSCREHEYDGFNLVVADESAAILLEWDGHLSVTPFEPGVHVVVNVGADGTYVEPPRRPEAGPEQAHNAGRLRAHLAPEPGESADEWLDRAGEALGDHEFGVCVHGDGYGTVSASLVRVGAGGIRYDHAEGPPCETAFEPVPVDA
ncbi:NRDE family protein [Halobaculum sp. EA56]|uniref:NRDE family protein n=1 Tax=Halobaculum sp. EA56 TaxID=3421648 RepID=UPI003EBBC811